MYEISKVATYKKMLEEKERKKRKWSRENSRQTRNDLTQPRERKEKEDED